MFGVIMMLTEPPEQHFWRISFGELGTEVRWHIPNRLKEGYGLNAKWFTNPENIHLATDFLLITVDCGISDYEQIEVIKKIGGKGHDN